MDSAALHSCLKCRRRMSSLKHDSHTICSHCRDVVCSVETRCSECKSWSVETMQEFIKYQRSLAGKRSKKPAVTAASVSQPAVDSSPVEPSTPSVPSISDDSRLKDAVLAVLQSLSGNLGINQSSSTALSTVPDYAPSVGGATGGDGGMKLHNVDSQCRSSDVGALDNSAMSTSPVLQSDLSHVLYASARHSINLGTVQAAPVAAPLGLPPPPLASSGDDQLGVPGLGPLPSSSSSLSPTSLLFPLTPAPSVPPSSSSTLLRSPLSSSSGALPSLFLVCCSFSLFFVLLFFLCFSSSSSLFFLHSFILIFGFFSFFFLRYSFSSSFDLFSFPYPFPFPFHLSLFFCVFLFLSSCHFFLLPFSPVLCSSSSSWFSSFLFLCLFVLVFLFSSYVSFLFFLFPLLPLPLFFLLRLLLLLLLFPPLLLPLSVLCPLPLWRTTRRGC